MRKSVKYTYRGANKDFTKSKHSFEYYFEAEHIKILATNDQSTGSITNEKGNSNVVTLPSITIDQNTNTINYGSSSINYTNGNEIDNQIINGLLPISSNSQIFIGQEVTRTGIVLFSTDNLGTDCIWEIENVIEGDYTLKLLYIRNLGFSSNNPIQALYNYENENIQKVYWVDGNKQIRFINIKNDNIDDNELLIETPSTSIDFVGIVEFSQPIIQSIDGGGNHTSGMIQYAYNLYRLNSSQTKISPLSELIPLDKGSNKGGGELNEVVGSTPVVRIEDIDTSYDFIKVYAIKYTSFNQIPTVSLIEEKELSGSDITIYDDGSVIEDISITEFLFLGSDPIVPKHIESKDNRLFPTNIETKPFIIPDELDLRAYSFASSGPSYIYDDVKPNNSNVPIGSATFIGVVGSSVSSINARVAAVPIKHDAINLDYDNHKYQYDGTTVGGEGLYIKYELTQQSLNDSEEYRFFKDREIYRIGVILYNRLGQISLPKWVADFKAPSGNLEGNYNTLNVEFKPEFYTFLDTFNFENEDDKPIGYKIIRAERNQSDKTILAQGILTPMMFQVLGDEALDNNQFASNIIRQSYQDSKVKFPNFLTREFSRIPTSTGDSDALMNGTLQESKHLSWMNDNSNGSGGNITGEGGEIFTTIPSNKLSQTFQHTKMMQFYCPEIIFQNNLNFTTDLSLRILGLNQSTSNGVYAEERFTSTQLEKNGGRTLGGINPWKVDSSQFIDNNNLIDCFNVPERGNSNFNRAFIGPSGNNDTMNFKQYYRAFNTFLPDTTNNEYLIYGSPEITVRGNDRTFYNNDTRYEYKNTLQGFIVDGDTACNECDALTSINSFGIDNATIVLGNNVNINTNGRKSLEDLYNESSLTNADGVLITEIKKDEDFIYLGDIYGGNTYEEKKATSYIEIGEYNKIDVSSVNILSPGDTYVQKFKFLRINKTDVEVYDTTQSQISEIVEYFCETTIDLKNRNDISLNEWDSRFQPREEEYHQYNTVYSQTPNLITTEDVNFTFRRIDNFDARIQSTQLKIPNETIDSWTDILPNETMDLNGKYGPINNIVEYKDNLYAFQDEAIAVISINPRVQVQANDGLSIELGRGGILYDFDYITTKSGSINKWGIVSAKKGIYYYDALNKGIGRVPDATNILLSDIKGHHSFFNNNYSYEDIRVDNPILQQGVLFGYDNYNKDVYFTLHQGDQSFTYCYNELLDEFIDLKQYKPTQYIYKGEKFIIQENFNNKLYEQYAGNYNEFFDIYYPSTITLQINPESDYDCVFDTIHYNSELYLNDIDQPNQTLTHIQAYNEYQDSGRIPLIFSRTGNLRRKFREWQANIPRERRNRIRNPWIFLKLELDNTSNYKMILHDIIIHYTI